MIATATNTVEAATIAAGIDPVGIAITPDGLHAYVTNFDTAGTVSVIATTTNTVEATIPVGGFPIAVAVTPDSKHAYVANQSSNNVSVIRTATNTVVATVPVGSWPLRRGHRAAAAGRALRLPGKHHWPSLRRERPAIAGRRHDSEQFRWD